MLSKSVEKNHQSVCLPVIKIYTNHASIYMEVIGQSRTEIIEPRVATATETSFIFGNK